MKVVQINNYFNEGSTGTLAKTLMTFLDSEGVENYVFYGRGKKIKSKNIIKFSSNFECKLNSLISRFTGCPFNGSLFATIRLLRKIKKINPDIVHIQCINTNVVNVYLLLKFLAFYNFKVVITLHAEFMYTGGCPHSYDCKKWQDECFDCKYKKTFRSYFGDSSKSNFNKMKKCFEMFDEKNLFIVSVSPWLKKRASTSTILKRFKHFVVENGVNENLYHVCRNIKKEKKILFAVPFFSIDEPDNKGCKDFLELIELLPEYSFILIGQNQSNVDFKRFKNIEYIGKVNDKNILCKLYNAASLTLLLSKRETFSMVLAESLCCGTPVFGLYSGGPESIALNEYTFFGKNIQEIVYAIKNYDFSADRNLISRKALSKFSSNKMCKQYIALYKHILS